MTSLNPDALDSDAPAVVAGLALRCGDVDIDRPTRRLRRHGQPLALGSRAFDLLPVPVLVHEQAVSTLPAPQGLLRELHPGNPPSARWPARRPAKAR